MGFQLSRPRTWLLSWKVEKRGWDGAREGRLALFQEGRQRRAREEGGRGKIWQLQDQQKWLLLGASCLPIPKHLRTDTPRTVRVKGINRPGLTIRVDTMATLSPL